MPARYGFEGSEVIRSYRSRETSTISRASPTKTRTFGFSIAPRFTEEQALATSRIAGSISATSTVSIVGIDASHPAVLPVPRPITSARLGSGRRIPPTMPYMTCVGASSRAFPSLFPLMRNARPDVVLSATLLSRPSASHTMPRRPAWS